MEVVNSDPAAAINQLAERCYSESSAAGWWRDQATGQHLLENPFSVPAKLALIHSEISEAMEGHRKNKMDDHLPKRKMIEVELADAIIRICDLGGALKLDLGGAVQEKLLYNRSRLDHRVENRQKPGGKAF